MAVQSVTPLSITSLRGGMNDSDPPSMVPPDQCVLANNVEYFFSAIAERRLGTEPFDLTGSGLDNEFEVVHLSQRFPTNDTGNPEYWAIAATAYNSTTVARWFANVWLPVMPVDPIALSIPDIYNIRAQSLHNKQFFCYLSAQDRMHVWDGSSLRRTGLAQPGAAPTATDEGSGSYASTLRYYRIRYVTLSGTQVLLRSEPSVEVAFTPSGSGAGVTVTRPDLIGEAETDWELEVSLDDANFYKLATIADATTTYTDSTDPNTYSSNILSETIGDYDLLPSAKFVTADQDRLILGGHQTDPALSSRVMWTPVYADPGVGNDERLPLDLDNFVDLDTNQGGELTGLQMMSNGVGYAFKWTSIYSINRTGDNTRAYDVVNITHSRGALPGSVVGGVDAYGAACIYFLDPVYGPSRIGSGGLETIRGLRQTWKRVNTAATAITCHGVYYPDKQQIHWWMAADNFNTPSLKFVLQVNSVEDVSGGPDLTGGLTGRGWALADGLIATARCSAIFTEPVVVGGKTFRSFRPFIGLTKPNYIQRCDTGDTDAGQSYVALVRTRPYFLAGLLDKWGAMTCALLASASAADIRIRMVRDFGIESSEKTISLVPQASEEYVIRQLDSLAMSDATSIQFEFTDP